MHGIKPTSPLKQAPIEEQDNLATTLSSTITTGSGNTLRQYNTTTGTNLSLPITVSGQSSNHQFIGETVRKLSSLIQKCENNKKQTDEFEKSLEETKNYFDEAKKNFPKLSIVDELDNVINQLGTNFKEINSLLIHLIDKETEFNARLRAAFQGAGSHFTKNSLPLIEKMYEEWLSIPHSTTLPSRKAYDQTVDQLDAEIREKHSPKLDELKKEMHPMKLRVGFLNEENGSLLNRCKILINALQKEIGIH